MEDYINDPEAEYKRILNALQQYRSLLKYSNNQAKSTEYKKQIKKLEQYREQIEDVFLFDKEEDEANTITDENWLQKFPFLQNLYRRYHSLDVEELADDEIEGLTLYLKYFNDEFIPFLSERKIQLDFKYAYDRDSFYNTFQQLYRKYDDYINEVKRIRAGEYRQDHEQDAKRRKGRMRHLLLLEADNFFKAIFNFSEELIIDIDEEGVKCLNAESYIPYERYEDSKLLQGLTVYQGLKVLFDYSREIISFIDMPNLKTKE